jgi:hypothetical protein
MKTVNVDEEELGEIFKIDEGLFAGFIVYVDDIEVFRRLNVLLSRFLGAKLITAKLSDKKLYLTIKRPEDFKENLSRKGMER